MQDTTNNLSTSYYDTLKHQNITHRPNILGFVANDMMQIVLCAFGWYVAINVSEQYFGYAIIIMTLCSGSLLLHWQFTTTQKYRIGIDQLMYQRGLFSVRRDYIELYRVVDFEESRSLLEIILGIKTVTVYACDRTMPCLRIIGVPKDLNVIDAIRERCIRSRKLNGIYEIANNPNYQ